MMQRVKVTLSDGTVGWFMGPALVRPGDDRTARFAFTEPQPLPEGFTFMPWEEALA